MENTQMENASKASGGKKTGQSMIVWNFPMALTWLRIICIPVFTAFFYIPHGAELAQWVNISVTTVFVIASITDFLDGYFARKWNQSTPFGAFLDPVADKLMVAVALILLVRLDRTPAIFAIIIIGREITISALREWMAQIGKRNSVAVKRIGKFKTAAQMLAICFLLLYKVPELGLDLYYPGNALMLVACVLTVVSMFHYLNMAAKEFKETQA